MYLLDTNTCIYIMKNSYPALTAKLFSLNPADVAVSSITVFELEYGAAKSRWGEKTRQKLAMFLAPFSILSLYQMQGSFIFRISCPVFFRPEYLNYKIFL